MFRLKKASKKVGDFDVTDNTTEWLMLQRLEVGDMPSFVHMQRLWVREETPDEFDAEGNMVSKGLKKESVIKFYKGFIKDDKHIVEATTPLIYNTDHDAQKNFLKRLEWYLADGYKIVEGDQEMPTYYANERTPMVPENLQGMMSSLAQATNQHNVAKANPIIKIALAQKTKLQNP